MGAVSSILEFEERKCGSTLVLVDLHDECPPKSAGDPRNRDFLDAMEKCRTALSCARRNGLPVAFVRYTAPPSSFLANRVYPSWLHDIRPQRSDMVFERCQPSCFASSEFAQMARQARGLVLAGLFGETSCLSTLLDGYGRSHVFTYLADASVSRGHGGISAGEMHRSVVGIASIYSVVSSTQEWTDQVSRKIGTAG